MIRLWLSQLVENVYHLENGWGFEVYALCGAVLVTLLVLSRMTRESKRIGYTWFWSLLRSFLWSAWVFPLIYCLVLRAPIWMTTVFTLGMGIGGGLIYSYLVGRKYSRSARGSSN